MSIGLILDNILPCKFCGEKRDVVEMKFKLVNKLFGNYKKKSYEELEEGKYDIVIYKSVCEYDGKYALYRMQSKFKKYDNFINYYKNHKFNKKDVRLLNKLKKMCNINILKNVNDYIKKFGLDNQF